MEIIYEIENESSNYNGRSGGGGAEIIVKALSHVDVYKKCIPG